MIVTSELLKRYADVEVTRPCTLTFHLDVGLLARRKFLRLVETNRRRGLRIELDAGPGLIERRYYVKIQGMWGQARTFLRVLDALAERHAVASTPPS